MKRTLIILSLSWLTCLPAWSQDPVCSQFYTSSLYLNPALSGFEKDVVFGINYRTQWAGVNLPFRTFQFSAIHPIIQQGIKSKHLGGVGATLFSDEAGPNREAISQGFSLASTYTFHLSRKGNHIIATALQFGVIQRIMNMNALQWSSQYSSALGYDRSLPGEELIGDRVTSPVINAGAAGGAAAASLCHDGGGGSSYSGGGPVGVFGSGHAPSTAARLSAAPATTSLTGACASRACTSRS